MTAKSALLRPLSLSAAMDVAGSRDMTLSAGFSQEAMTPWYETQIFPTSSIVFDRHFH